MFANQLQSLSLDKVEWLMGYGDLQGLVSLKKVLPYADFVVKRVVGKKLPFQVSFSLTNRCNFRCVYCDIPLQKRDEMSTREWMQVTDDFVAGGSRRFSLIGGEPMLRKDLGRIVRHIKGHDVHLAMNTNGWFITERFDEIKGIDAFCITLDGPRDLHDQQRHKGSYDRAVEAIEALLAAGKVVVTMTVVRTDGHSNFEHVLDLAEHYGFKSFFQIEHHRSADVDAPVGVGLTDDNIRELSKYLIQLKKAGRPVANSVSVSKALFDDGRYIGGPCFECHAGKYSAYVFSDGTVAPCLFTQRQQVQENGRLHGFLQAFEEMAPPVGKGCACVPSHELNQVLDFRVPALWNALKIVQPGN